MNKRTIIEGVTVLYIILFLYTGINKIMDFEVFKQQLGEIPLLKPFSVTIAVSLPMLEFLAVFTLLIPRWRLKGIYISSALMIIFTIYIIAILLFNKTLPCSCGGIIQEMSWPQHLIFNTVFIVFGLIAIQLFKKIRNETSLHYSSLLNSQVSN
jgi:hypothetical protein